MREVVRGELACKQYLESKGCVVSIQEMGSVTLIRMTVNICKAKVSAQDMWLFVGQCFWVFLGSWMACSHPQPPRDQQPQVGFGLSHTLTGFVLQAEG